MVAGSSNRDGIQGILISAKKDLTKEEINEFLLATYKDGLLLGSREL
jgi:hypothetical protein